MVHYAPKVPYGDALEMHGIIAYFGQDLKGRSTHNELNLLRRAGSRRAVSVSGNTIPIPRLRVSEPQNTNRR